MQYAQAPSTTFYGTTFSIVIPGQFHHQYHNHYGRTKEPLRTLQLAQFCYSVIHHHVYESDEIIIIIRKLCCSAPRTNCSRSNIMGKNLFENSIYVLILFSTYFTRNNYDFQIIDTYFSDDDHDFVHVNMKRTNLRFSWTPFFAHSY